MECHSPNVMGSLLLKKDQWIESIGITSYNNVHKFDDKEMQRKNNLRNRNYSTASIVYKSSCK